MELGARNHNKDGVLGPNITMVAFYADPPGKSYRPYCSKYSYPTNQPCS